MTTLDGLPLDDVDSLLLGRVPESLAARDFDALWALHPDTFHLVRGNIPTPRWSQAYGHDYRYSGSINRAAPLAQEFAPFLDWGQEAIDRRLNGMLVNWYDLDRGHYIGAHKDSPVGLLEDAPIVTISLGVARTFRLRRRSRRVDVPVEHGTVVVLPASVNRRWDHQVPKAKGEGRRISITLRAFEEEPQRSRGL